MGEKESLQRTLFLPAMMILGILPLMVRAKVGYIEEAVAEIFRKGTYMEFYAQGKAIILIGVACLMIVLAGLVLAKKQLMIKKSKYIAIYIIGSVLFLAGAIVSTILSQYQNVALFGIFDRAEGLIVLIAYIVVMFYMVFIFNEEKHSKYVSGSLAFAIVILTIIGIGQYVGKDLILTDIGKMLIIPNSLKELRGMITNQFTKGMITCTLYNPNYVGSFSAIVLPIFVALCFMQKSKGKLCFYIFITGCAIFLLVGSKSSAGLLATILVMIVAAIILSKYIILACRKHKKAVIISGSFFVVAIAISAPLWLGEFKALTTQIYETAFTVHEADEYLQKVAIKDVVTVGNETIFKMAEGDLVVGRDGESIYFVDENDVPVEVEDQGDLIIIKDSRFDDYLFQKFYESEEKAHIKALGLAEYENGFNTDEAYLTLFALDIGEEGITLVDSYSGKPIFNKVPTKWGFAGKELIGSGRGYIWARTLPMLKETILIGHGPDTYALYYPQDDLIGKYYTYHAPTMVVDKPHNMYLQIAINLGGIALVGFLILVVTYLVQSIKLYGFKESYTTLDCLGIGIMLGVFGYMIAAFFNDSTICVAPIFYSVLGVGIAINHIKHKEMIK